MLIIFYVVVFFFATRLLVLWIKRIRDERRDKQLEEQKITTKMSSNDFWKIIENAKSNSEDLASQIEWLKNELRKLTENQLVAFDNRFIALKNKAYRWDLWGAIYLLQGGCSDDSFEYFREWLIAQGRARFEETIKNPESVKDFVGTDNNWEGLGYCALAIYKEKTGKNYIPSGVQLKQDPAGEEWEESKLPELFPSIWNRLNKNR